VPAPIRAVLSAGPVGQAEFVLRKRSTEGQERIGVTTDVLPSA
jgi:hypothetical protein